MRGALLLFGALIFAVILDSCKSQELEYIEPFNFEIEIEIPEVDIDADVPAVVAPPIPSVQASAAAQQLTGQVNTATNPADVPTSVKSSVSTAATVATSSGVTTTQVQAFNKNGLNTISTTPPSQLDQTILSASTSAAQNPIIKSLFPTVSLPGGRIAAAEPANGSGPINGGNPVVAVLPPGLCNAFYPTFKESELVDGGSTTVEVCAGRCGQIQCFDQITGICADKSREQFGAAFTEGRNYINGLQGAGLDEIYNPLFAAIPGRKTTRDNTAKATFDASLLAVTNQVKDLIDASDRFLAAANQSGNPADLEVATNVRFFAMLYFYYSYSQIYESYQSTLTINAQAAVKEDDDLDKAKVRAFNNLEFKFWDEIVFKIEDAFTKAIGNCHNQGTGN